MCKFFIPVLRWQRWRSRPRRWLRTQSCGIESIDLDCELREDFLATNNEFYNDSKRTQPNGQIASRSETSKSPIREHTPNNYVLHPPDWFRPGRFFSIWAKRDEQVDVEIHDKMFILLDSKNIEGKGVLVETLDKDGLRRLVDSNGTKRTNMALKCCESSDSNRGIHCELASQATYAQAAQQLQLQQSKERDQEQELCRVLDNRFKNIHLDEDNQHDVPAGTYVRLEHTYNIPFVKYKCVDHGMLEKESLQALRFHSVQYLIYEFDLTSTVRDLYSGRRR